MEKLEDKFQSFPNSDKDWSENDWKKLLEYLVKNKLVSWKDIASALLGQLNPPQVGTSIASSKSFQSHFPPRKTWQNVRSWFYKQNGTCIDCGTRLDLQADHVNPRQFLGDSADTLDNLVLRCRRHNVDRRPSHKNGGKTFLTSSSALMWILFTRTPKTYQEFKKLCRDYQLTMADIRFQEAWAMARWLERKNLYTIDKDSTY
ncbi:HNH endonuclease [Lactiplantibacillus plantarum]|uniref:HNH endonuclease n=1 Tax=Lactiplantibacillus plantarum TaxID=1590 RepID=UPI00097693B1|nr:HNH endonuclease [Lactiplantibacillus plantarum]